MKSRIMLKPLTAALLALCSVTAQGAEVSFAPSSLPSGASEMTRVHSSASVSVTGADGAARSLPLAYHVLYHSGDVVGGWPAGQIVNREGKPLMLTSYDESAHEGQGPFYAKGPDSNSLIEQRNGKQSAYYLVTHFEYDTDAPATGAAPARVNLYGKLPMAINVATLKQDPASGALQAVSLKNVDMKSVDGLWTPCAGEKTPWNTHLGSEEYEPDARNFERVPLEAMNAYLGTSGKLTRDGGANPYAYGFITEVRVDSRGAGHIVKHYSMGRFSHELGTVMPDRRTVYLSDDGRDVMMGMYVADRAGDLSSGTLYAAKWNQTDGSNGGKANLQWIRLGHATDAEVRSMIRSKLRFSEIFDFVTAEGYQQNPQRFAGYRPVFVYGGTGGVTRLEYLKLKPGMEKTAAFLETRRYAAYLGATTEFSKMEGLTSNPADRQLYFAVSYAEGGMPTGKNGERPQNDISLSDPDGALACGVVYASSLQPQARDMLGKPINSRWVAGATRALLTGRPNPVADSHDKCDPERIGNPDNIKYSPQMRTLFIGEDSGNHLNNMLWAYNTVSGQLTRLATAPIGAEWTGLAPVVTADGYAYLMANVQHPGADDDLSKYPVEIREDMASHVDKRGMVGYIPLGKLD